MSSLELDRRLVGTRIRRVHDSLNGFSKLIEEHQFGRSLNTDRNPTNKTLPSIDQVSLVTTTIESKKLR